MIVSGSSHVPFFCRPHWTGLAYTASLIVGSTIAYLLQQAPTLPMYCTYIAWVMAIISLTFLFLTGCSDPGRCSPIHYVYCILVVALPISWSPTRAANDVAYLLLRHCTHRFWTTCEWCCAILRAVVSGADRSHLISNRSLHCITAKCTCRLKRIIATTATAA